jgi:two-component SAPR family response regulator
MKRKKGKLSSSTKGLTKEFDDQKGKVNLKSNIYNIDIEIPKEVKNPKITIQNDKIIYNSEDKKLDVILENVDGGIRQVIVINDIIAKPTLNHTSIPTNPYPFITSYKTLTIGLRVL